MTIMVISPASKEAIERITTEPTSVQEVMALPVYDPVSDPKPVKADPVGTATVCALALSPLGMWSPRWIEGRWYRQRVV